ncbi:MAG: hypothetical protein IPH10_08655 [bacterium]|nr:hypothetical protein [bacterium]
MDGLLVKLDSGLSTVWSRDYGSPSKSESFANVDITSDGGIVAAGWEQIARYGSVYAWLVQLDANGDTLWTNYFGSGLGGDQAECILQAADGGFFVTGFSQSEYGNVSDGWLWRTDASGTTLFTENYGGSAPDYLYDAMLDSEGLTLFGGSDGDYFVVRTDLDGDLQWQQSFGGSGDDALRAGTPTSDGGYALAGGTSSYGAGGYDMLMLKFGGCLDETAPPLSPEIVISLLEDEIQLSWPAVTHNVDSCRSLADTYEIYAVSSLDSNFHYLATVTDTSFVHSGVLGTAQMFYYVVAVDIPPARSMPVERPQTEDDMRELLDLRRHPSRSGSACGQCKQLMHASKLTGLPL